MLLKDDLKRPGQVLMERYEVGPGDSESTRGWSGSVKWWSLCVSSS